MSDQFMRKSAQVPRVIDCLVCRRLASIERWKQLNDSVKNRFCQLALLALIGWVSTCGVRAQAFTTLHSFTDSGPVGEGISPAGSLLLSGNVLYGTTSTGGFNGGTLFHLNIDGTGFKLIYDFDTCDGANPQGSLVLSDNFIYGTTYFGGSCGPPNLGTVFAISIDNTGPVLPLYVFSGYDGGLPSGGLVLLGNTLFGTTKSGGAASWGTIFAVTTDWTSFMTLYTFTGGDDGGAPYSLILSSNTMYGVTRGGGSSESGTVFAINTDGGGFINLHRFTALTNGINNDGAHPLGNLVLDGNVLYGTTFSGGASGNGTIFRLNTDGKEFTTLHTLSGGSDGANPQAGLTLSDNTLYGTSYGGGQWTNGTVFQLNTNGTGFKTLHSFTALSGGANNDGANPAAGLTLSGNTVYGTAFHGGSSGGGTLFSILLPVSQPRLTITHSEPNVILAWPTNATGLSLEFSASLVSSVWSTNLPSPVVINGQNAVTNPIYGTQKFFRLSQ